MASPTQYVAAAAGMGETYVVERLEHLGGDVVGAVLVADDRDRGDLAVGERTPLVVGLGAFRVQTFQDLAGAGRLTQPDRGRDDQDLRVQEFGADLRGRFVRLL
jgi:hypothetical protein